MEVGLSTASHPGWVFWAKTMTKSTRIPARAAGAMSLAENMAFLPSSPNST